MSEFLVARRVKRREGETPELSSLPALTRRATLGLLWS